MEVIAAELDGAEFVAAVRSFADRELDDRSREILGEVLLDRAGEDEGRLDEAFAEIDEERQRPLLFPRSRRRLPPD